jgi:hypothetical protein
MKSLLIMPCPVVLLTPHNTMASITQFLSISASTNPTLESDNIVLAPGTIHLNPSDTATIQPDEFKIQGHQYVRCDSLAKEYKETNFGSLEVWRGYPIQA